MSPKHQGQTKEQNVTDSHSQTFSNISIGHTQTDEYQTGSEVQTENDDGVLDTMGVMVRNVTRTKLKQEVMELP